MTEDRITLQVRRSLVNPSAPPKALHQALFTRVGTDIALDLGHFDLPELREVIERAKAAGSGPTELTLHVTDRFVLSPQNVQSLWRTMQQIVKDLRDSGQWPPDGDQ